MASTASLRASSLARSFLGMASCRSNCTMSTSMSCALSTKRSTLGGTSSIERRIFTVRLPLDVDCRLVARQLLSGGLLDGRPIEEVGIHLAVQVDGVGEAELAEVGLGEK